MIRDINNQLLKWKKWTIEYDYTQTYIVGHASPLPDGDCICSAFGFAHTISILQNELKKSGNAMNPVRAIFCAPSNQYVEKVINYITTQEKELQNKSKFILTSNSNNFGVSESDFKADIRARIREHKRDCGDANHALGIAFFVLDTDYQRTGFTDFFDNIQNIISDIKKEVEFEGRVDLFFGAIDHHPVKYNIRIIPKGFSLKEVEFEGRYNTRILPKGFSLIEDNTLELIFEKASSTSEIILSILSTEYSKFKNLNLCQKHYDDEAISEKYSKMIVATIGKILMGGIRTDTGNFIFNGHESAFESIAEFIYLYDLTEAEFLKVDQNLIISLVEPKKDPNFHSVYAYLNKCVQSVNDTGIIFMAVNDNEFEDIKGKTISEMGMKPIHTLQEYDYKAAIAATVNRTDRTIKFEIRSSDAVYNCREFAQSVHPGGGGHLQAAGVTLTVGKEAHLGEVTESVINQFIQYIFKIEGEMVCQSVELTDIHDQEYDDCLVATGAMS